MGQSPEHEEGGLSPIGRFAAIGAVLLGVLAVVMVMMGSDDYVVKARFQAATQIVKGNQVQIGGRPAGLVKSIELTDDGQAELELEIEAEFAPLREGTRAELRIASLSGVVNRFVDLRLPEASPGRDPPEIPDGGVIDARDTSSAVDLDQLFDLFDAETRKGLQRFIRGSAAQYAGRGQQANLGWQYLNPSLLASQRLFSEINRDSPLLERFLVASSNLVTDLGDRRDDLALLVDRLATATGAIAREEQSLTRAVENLPPFMRRANSTFVNLRSTLDDVDPLVEESKPVAPRLRAVLKQLRPFARDAVPTFRSLARLARRPGKHNDLYELAQSTLPFRDIATRTAVRNGKERRGSFPTATDSLAKQTPILAHFRPYAVDFTGWLDDFSHSGAYDANGSFSRSAISVNAFAAVNGVLQPVPPELRQALINQVVAVGQNQRCPGSIERGAIYKPSPDFECDETQLPVGP